MDRRVQFIDALEELCQRFDLVFWDLGDERSYGVAHRQDVIDAANGDPKEAAEALFRFKASNPSGR